MASAGTVTLNLDADSVKLIRELNKAQKQTKRSATRMRSDMKKAFTGMAKSAAVFGVAMAAAAATAAKFSISMADNIGKSADALGLGVEEFQEYEFAATRAGIAATQFTSNMTAFVKRVGEAKAGMGPLVSGLKNLNPTLLENLKNTTNQGDALRLVAEAVKKSDSATERAAITNAAFSRAGVAMVNMLDDGAAGLDKVAREARDLGVVMKESLVRDAEEATDKMGDLTKVLQVRTAETVTENADAIITLANALISFVGIVGKATQGWNLWLAGQGIGVESVDEIREFGESLLAERRGLEKELAGIAQIDNPLLKPAQWVIDFKQARIDEIKAQQKILQERAIAIQKAQSNKISSGAETPEVTIPVTLDVSSTQAEASEIAKVIDSLRDQVATFGMSDDQKALFNLIDLETTDEQIAMIKMVQEELRLLNEGQAAAEAVAENRNELAEEYADLIASTLTASENHHNQISRIDQMWAAGVIPTVQEYIDMLERVNDGFEGSQEGIDELTEFGVQAARNMQDAFADFLFDPFDDGVKGMAKSFAKTIQRMAADAAAQAILGAIFGGLAGSSNAGLAAFGAAFGGGRAAGGPVDSGTPYMVGEKGPELIIPNSSGTVIPNNELGGQSVVVNIDARETDNPGRLLALVPVITAQVEQSISLKSRRGYM